MSLLIGVASFISAGAFRYRGLENYDPTKQSKYK